MLHILPAQEHWQSWCYEIYCVSSQPLSVPVTSQGHHTTPCICVCYWVCVCVLAIEGSDLMRHTWPSFIMKWKFYINLVEVSVSRVMLNSCRDLVIAALCMISHVYFKPKGLKSSLFKEYTGKKDTHYTKCCIKVLMRHTKRSLKSHWKLQVCANYFSQWSIWWVAGWVSA